MEKKSVIVSFIILVLLTVGTAGAGIYYYTQYTKAINRANDPALEAKELIAKLGKLIDLPTGEEPTVATVKDAEQIKTQPFFAKAKNGYRVILYPSARMAILYDDKANRIINIGTINVSDNATPSASQNTQGITGTQTPQQPEVKP